MELIILLLIGIIIGISIAHYLLNKVVKNAKKQVDQMNQEMMVIRKLNEDLTDFAITIQQQLVSKNKEG